VKGVDFNARNNRSFSAAVGLWMDKGGHLLDLDEMASFMGVHMLCGVTAGDFLGWPFLDEPTAVRFLTPLVVMASRMNAREGPGNWGALHDGSMICFGKVVTEFSQRLGVNWWNALWKKPVDAHCIELPTGPLRQEFAAIADGVRDEAVLHRLARVVMKGLSQLTDILSTLEEGIRLRLTLIHLAQGRGLPERMARLDGVSFGAAFHCVFEAPGEEAGSERLATLADLLHRRVSASAAAQLVGMQVGDYNFHLSRSGLLADRTAPDYADAKVLIVFGAGNGVPCTAFTNQADRLLQARNCLKLDNFPPLREKVAIWGIEHFSLVLIGVSDFNGHTVYVLEGTPGDRYAARFAARLFAPGVANQDVFERRIPWSKKYVEIFGVLGHDTRSRGWMLTAVRFDQEPLQLLPIPTSVTDGEICMWWTDNGRVTHAGVGTNEWNASSLFDEPLDDIYISVPLPSDGFGRVWYPNHCGGRLVRYVPSPKEDHRRKQDAVLRRPFTDEGVHGRFERLRCALGLARMKRSQQRHLLVVGRVALESQGQDAMTFVELGHQAGADRRFLKYALATLHRIAGHLFPGAHDARDLVLDSSSQIEPQSGPRIAITWPGGASAPSGGWSPAS
jgi:hypothetical protein